MPEASFEYLRYFDFVIRRFASGRQSLAWHVGLHGSIPEDLSWTQLHGTRSFASLHICDSPRAAALKVQLVQTQRDNVATIEIETQNSEEDLHVRVQSGMHHALVNV